MNCVEDGGVVRRNRPGTKAEDLYNWPFQEYTDMDSTLDGKRICLSENFLKLSSLSHFIIVQSNSTSSR